MGSYPGPVIDGGDLRGTQVTQVCIGLWLATHRCHFVAAAREHVDREAADAAGRTGDHHPPFA